jgi:hypothetical protein
MKVTVFRLQASSRSNQECPNGLDRYQPQSERSHRRQPRLPLRRQMVCCSTPDPNTTLTTARNYIYDQKYGVKNPGKYHKFDVPALSSGQVGQQQEALEHGTSSRFGNMLGSFDEIGGSLSRRFKHMMQRDDDGDAARNAGQGGQNANPVRVQLTRRYRRLWMWQHLKSSS